MVESSDRSEVSEVEDEPPIPQPLIDFDSSDSPIYLQLITLFRRQIMLGSWPVNSRIPTIETLAAQFGVANGTIRQALSFLEREGLIKRIRRRGTFVIKLPDQPNPITLPKSRAEVAELLNGLKSREYTAARHTTDSERLRSAYRIYHRGQLPVMLEHERADPTLFETDSVALKGLATLEPSEFGVNQLVTIGTADTETASKLNIPVNAAVCVVSHTVTDNAGTVVLESEWLMRGDLMHLVEHFAAHESGR